MTGQDSSKWEAAVAKAMKYKGKSVVYCVTFSHGLMKIGATKDLNNRLYGLTSHGLFRHMVEDVIATVCPKHYVFAAEKILLLRLKEVAVVKGPEIFETYDLNAVVSFMKESVAAAKRPESAPMTDADYMELAISSNMIPMLYYEAHKRAVPIAVAEIVDYMERGESNAFDWSRIYSRLSPVCWDLVVPIIEKNAVLIGRGVEYDDRKKMLEQHALDLKGDKQLILTS